MPRNHFKRTGAGLIVADTVERPLAPNEVRIDWDVDVSSGQLTEIITRADENGNTLSPVIVTMKIADIMELAATMTLQSLAYVREMTVQKTGKVS